MNCNKAILVNKIPNSVSKEEITTFFSTYGNLLNVESVSEASFREYYDSTDKS